MNLSTGFLVLDEGLSSFGVVGFGGEGLDIGVSGRWGISLCSDIG